MVFRGGDREGISRRQQSIRDFRKLTANEGGIIRTLQSQILP